MKKIFTAIPFVLIIAAAKAQTDPRIVAIIDKEPANNAAQLNANAELTGKLEEEGIINMLLILQPTGAGDNTKVYDAISGFSFYVTQKGKEDWRAMAVRAYGKALVTVSDKNNQAFIISQLQIVGKDDAIGTLQKYLHDERLCDPAARALVKINSPASKAALLSGLKGAQGNCKLSITEALGDSRNALAVKSISAQVGSDKQITKVSLYALANIADPISINLMANAAQQSKFTYDETNATSAYLLYIRNLGGHGKQDVALRLAKTLMTKASLANEVQTQTAALKIIVDLQGAKSVPSLVIASRSQDYKYRIAAVRFGVPYLNQATTALWVKELNHAYTIETDVTIINMLGDNRVQAAYPALLKLSSTSNHSWTTEACVIALAKIGQNKALDHLLQVMSIMNSSSDEFAIAMKNALFTMKGNDVVAKVAKALSGSDISPSAQVILIETLGERQAHSKINVVFPLLNSKDPSVRAAAYSALKQLSGQDNLDQLFSLLNASTQTSETTDLQAAIIAVVSRSKDKPAQSVMVLQQMDKASADKRSLYFNILASIGDKRSLNAVSNAYQQGDGATKQAAVAALAQWADVSASPELLKISKEATDASLKNQALRGFIALITKSDYPADEKVIYLRDAMEAAQTVPQKQLILQEISNEKTFPALVFASNYLDDPQLQEEAANTVSTIALSSKDFYGDVIKFWLNKTLLIKKGGDSDYEKVAIRKFIAEMPPDAGLVPLFNNHDLTGWKGLVGNPIERSKMSKDSLAIKQKAADEIMRKGWYVKDSILNFSGDGENICTTKQYRNFEMYVDWKILKEGDAGIYLRGSPQVQIWDTSRRNVGAQVGSGGLYNNDVHESKPLKLADNAIGDWNNFHIIMKGDKVTVYFNGVLVVNNVVMDNYWDRKQPIFPKEQIELQAHGNHVFYRDIYLRELPD